MAGALMAAALCVPVLPGAPPPATAQQRDRGEPATINAQTLQFDRPANMAYGEGEVVVRYQDATLTADKVRFNMQTKEAWAEGNVRLHRPNEEWIAPSLYYNFETGNLVTERVRGFVDPLHVGAASIRQADDREHYAFTQGTLTTCDYDEPHFRLQATHGEIWPGDRIVAYNVTARVGNVPVFWVPMLIWSLSGDEPPLVVSVGYSSASGFMALTSTWWRFGENLKLVVHLDGRTRRGVGSGADLKYRLGGDGRGEVRGYYAYDNRPNDSRDIAAGRDNPNHRYRAQWRHNQEVSETLSLKVNLNKLSDPDIIEDYFSEEFRLDREPESVADLTQRGPNHTLSLLVRPQFNDFFAEVERLPEVKWSVNRLRLAHTPLFYEGESSAGYYKNQPRDERLAADRAEPAFEGEAVRFDTFHQLLSPHTLFGWWAVVPRAGVRYTYYTKAPETAPDDQEVRRLVFNAGMETSFKASRTWNDVGHKRLQIDGLRHIVEPFANYQWVPEPNLTGDELFQFDTVRTVRLASGEQLALTRYSPLDFPAFNTIDAIERQNLVRFGLRQKLQTRRAQGPWDLVEVEGWTDYRIERDSGQREFSDLFGTVRLRPFEWIAADAFARYDLDQGILREFNSALGLAGGDRWSLSVGTRFIRDDSHVVNARLAVRLSRHWLAETQHRVDIRDGEWEEQQYALRQETHDWYLTYGFRYRSQRVRDDELSVFFAVTLKAYPSLTTGSRIDLATAN
jgi:LPS-assembly protein